MAYNLKDLPDARGIAYSFSTIKEKAIKQDLRLTFHPDQFVVLNSPKKEVAEKSINELEYHGMIAKKLGADVINIHGGRGYGDKIHALKRFEKNFTRLSKQVQKCLTVENEDTVFTPKDLLPLCHDLGIPLVYDVHHHRCFGDGLNTE